jgi:hypothetical protein
MGVVLHPKVWIILIGHFRNYLYTLQTLTMAQMFDLGAEGRHHTSLMY